jgi:CRISPR system Cascade subunit CasA
MADLSFNLVDEKWIPCIWLDGSVDELSLLETLTRAHEIREVFDPSPLVTASLHRLLLAILHHNFGPASTKEWKQIWQSGCFDEKKLRDYFYSSERYSRFDLFDKEHPFYQFADLDKEVRKLTPLKRLAFEYAAQNNPTLFDHSTDDVHPSFPAKTAALWLLATQTFAPTAGKSETIHTKDSPWSRAAVVLINGDNLFETLMFNLIHISLLSREISDFGKPIWEYTDTIKPTHGVIPDSYLQYLTLPSRAIKMIPFEDVNGEVQVAECLLAQGASVIEDFKDDPLLAYTVDEEKGRRALQLRENRAVWRDSLALFSVHRASKPFHPPRSMELLREMVEQHILAEGSLYRLSIYGQNLERGQAKINFWRHERMPLPLKYFTDERLLEDLKAALSLSEGIGAALRIASNVLAEELGGREKFGDLVRHLGAERLFWSRLEEPFYVFLTGLPTNRDEAFDAWENTLRRTALGTFEDATRDLDSSARTLRALVEARRRLNIGIAIVFKQKTSKEV